MLNTPGWNEHRRPCGKLNSKLQTEEYQVATEGVVEGTQGSEGAEPMGQVAKVNVAQRYGLGSAIEAGSRKNAVREVMCEEGVVFE